MKSRIQKNSSRNLRTIQIPKPDIGKLIAQYDGKKAKDCPTIRLSLNPKNMVTCERMATMLRKHTKLKEWQSRAVALEYIVLSGLPGVIEEVQKRQRCR